MPRRWYKVGLVALTILLLAASAGVHRVMNRQRSALTRVAPLENAPPVLAFTTVALGGFRGLIANALWIRANDLQNDGKYFEMVQLADWITKLEPTFVQVWIVQAWNMAYNISVKFPDPADRWRWVQRGIELLRDDAVRYNPKEALLYRELGWFFQHKMGQNMDDAHVYYKQAWAIAMTNLFGGAGPNYDELTNPATPEAQGRLKMLREQYKMDPQQMREVDRLYGPLDWRLPEAHAIYWAHVGLEYSKKEDLITLRRVIYQSMHMVVLRGRLISINPLRFGPDLNQITRANAAYESMMAEETELKHSVRNAHKNFLREVVYLLYTHNRLGEANHWLKQLRDKYPESVEPGLSVEEYALQRLTTNLPTMSHDRIKILIEGLITQYYIALAFDEDDRAEGLHRMAQYVWSYYMKQTGERRSVLALPPFNEMKRTVLEQLLKDDSLLTPELKLPLRARLGIPVPSSAPPPEPTPP